MNCAWQIEVKSMKKKIPKGCIVEKYHLKITNDVDVSFYSSISEILQRSIKVPILIFGIRNEKSVKCTQSYQYFSLVLLM